MSSAFAFRLIVLSFALTALQCQTRKTDETVEKETPVDSVALIAKDLKKAFAKYTQKQESLQVDSYLEPQIIDGIAFNLTNTDDDSLSLMLASEDVTQSIDESMEKNQKTDKNNSIRNHIITGAAGAALLVFSGLMVRSFFFTDTNRQRRPLLLQGIGENNKFRVYKSIADEKGHFIRGEAESIDEKPLYVKNTPFNHIFYVETHEGPQYFVYKNATEDDLDNGFRPALFEGQPIRIQENGQPYPSIVFLNSKDDVLNQVNGTFQRAQYLGEPVKLHPNGWMYSEREKLVLRPGFGNNLGAMRKYRQDQSFAMDLASGLFYEKKVIGNRTYSVISTLGAVDSNAPKAMVYLENSRAIVSLVGADGSVTPLPELHYKLPDPNLDVTEIYRELPNGAKSYQKFDSTKQAFVDVLYDGDNQQKIHLHEINGVYFDPDTNLIYAKGRSNAYEAYNKYLPQKKGVLSLKLVSIKNGRAKLSDGSVIDSTKDISQKFFMWDTYSKTTVTTTPYTHSGLFMGGFLGAVASIGLISWAQISEKLAKQNSKKLSLTDGKEKDPQTELLETLGTLEKRLLSVRSH